MPFDLQPHLIGELIELRPLATADFEALYAIAADPLIWEQHPESDRWTREKFEKYFQGAMDSGGAFLVLDRRTGQVIGSSRYCGYDEAAGEIEIGWTFLARSHWGGAFNGEMKKLMLNHAFQDVRSVVFLIGPDNIRSRKAVEKIGAILIGTRLNALGRESVVYRIEAAEVREEK